MKPASPQFLQQFKLAQAMKQLSFLLLLLCFIFPNKRYAIIFVPNVPPKFFDYFASKTKNPAFNIPILIHCWKSFALYQAGFC